MVSRTWAGCSSSGCARCCWRPSPGSPPRAGRGRPTASGCSCPPSRCASAAGRWRPPVVVRCVWVRGGDAPRLGPGSALTFWIGPADDDRVVGEAEMLAAIDRHPEVRLALPSVLALRAPPAAGDSTLDLAAACALAEVFVPTAAYERALATLRPPPLRRAHRAAGDGQDGDRPDDRARAAARRLGGARVHPARAGVRAAATRTGRRCSSPTTRSARPSTARTRPSAGRASSTASCAPRASARG